MPTKYCMYCGYQIYDHQNTAINIMSNGLSGAQNRHTTWEDCQYSIDKGDGLEQDGIRKWQAMRRRSAGLHFQ